MSERYGVWCLDAEEWCTAGGEPIVGSHTLATRECWLFKRTIGTSSYEVRPYPETAHDWTCPDCKRATPSAASFRLHDKGCPVLVDAYSTVTRPTAESRIVVTADTEALAFALFSTDDAVIDFCTRRAERREAIDGVLAKAWERDEGGWATLAKIRATRVAARLAKKEGT